MTIHLKILVFILFISIVSANLSITDNQVSNLRRRPKQDELKVKNKNRAILSGGYLLASEQTLLNRSDSLDSKISDILTRVGPDMRPMRGFRDFSDISLDVAKRAWRLMHKHAESVVSEELDSIWPLAEEALNSAQVSLDCREAAFSTVEAAKRLDSWAIQLLNSWGNFPPVGIYEGTFGDIGSYHGCLNVPENSVVGHAHYCSISYQPILPSRANYELIIRKESDELLQMFESSRNEIQSDTKTTRDAFTDLLNNAQYSHFIYYKFGTCFPIQCSPFDVQKLAKLLGERSILISGPVKCHSKYEQDYQDPILKLDPKTNLNSSAQQLTISTRDLNNGVYIWKPHITKTQLIAVIIVGLILTVILSLTLVDIILNILPNLYKAHLKKTISKKVCSKTIATQSEGKHEVAVNTERENKAQEEKEVEVEVEEEEKEEEEDDYDDGEDDFDANNNQYEEKPLSFMVADSIEEDRETSKLNMYELADVVSMPEATTISVQARQSTSHSVLSQTLKENKDFDVARGEQHVGEYKEVRVKAALEQQKKLKQRSLFMNLVNDYSIVTNAKQFFRVNPSALREDILCINGLRCITMSWIIITHTMQYNDWSAFARTREIETHLKSLINQPLFNASYLVDTFFLISGLLTSFSSFKSIKSKEKKIGEVGRNRGSLLTKFSARSYLIGRYLRLTPQIMLVSLLFIILPLLSGTSGGPHWYTITGEYSENCAQNWWVNLFHIQAFYESNEMCNFVSWWISVDMFYHLFALALILLILRFSSSSSSSSSISSNERNGSVSGEYARGSTNQQAASKVKTLTAPAACAALTLAHAIPQVIRHYQLGLPPNLLSTIPQTGAMWSEMTLKLFWTPYAHAFPFFLGFYLGHLMSEHPTVLSGWFNRKRAILGWSITAFLLFSISYSTHYWVLGKWHYSRLVSTLFFLVCPIIWSSCLAWIILACHYEYGGLVNRILSCKLFIILGKASFIVYLSHFLIIFTFFGSQNLLLEPTQLLMLYVIIGNISLSMLLGSLLCIVFEMPWLKTQRRLMTFLR